MEQEARVTHQDRCTTVSVQVTTTKLKITTRGDWPYRKASGSKDTIQEQNKEMTKKTKTNCT